MVIDFHTHIFPDKIAQAALPKLSKASGGVEPCGLATVSSMTDVMKNSGVDKAVFLSIATNPKQQKNVNDFAIAQLDNPYLIPFGSVHPDSEEAFDELERLKAAGIKGVKLHPDYQGFFVDEDRMLPIYEKIAKLGLITVFHAGVDIGFPEPVHCTPERLARVLGAFDGAPVVAAHWGGYLMYDEVLKHLCGKNLYFDTSFSYSKVPPDYAKTLIKEHSAEKILFGTDMPWSSPENELKFTNSLDLDDGQLNAILSGNAQKLLFD